MSLRVRKVRIINDHMNVHVSLLRKKKARPRGILSRALYDHAYT
jgi:hypothetical protein